MCTMSYSDLGGNFGDLGTGLGSVTDQGVYCVGVFPAVGLNRHDFLKLYLKLEFL